MRLSTKCKQRMQCLFCIYHFQTSYNFLFKLLDQHKFSFHDVGLSASMLQKYLLVITYLLVVIKDFVWPQW